ncbi:MAG: YbbR-like domain-containing protein [Ekhidna sp.]|nr:YbbR-like domain-containing protein [Ekhidna sp.]MBC6410055.1 YbbR-like domain-containing protein [Ekhidna sp.]MBC6427521.1 YbbR-like domain-containing protein [Ekhidna sp.]
MADLKNFKRWKVITLSFLGAVIFWFFSALGKEYSYRFRYPIEFVFDQDSLIAVKPLPKYVEIDVTGGGWDLFRETFWRGGDPVIFDLDDPAAIRYLTRPAILPILTDQLSQFRVNFLFTDTLYIAIDKRGFRWVDLKIDSIKIDLDKDYRIVSNIEIAPDTAVIYGPESYLDSLPGAYTVKIDVEELDRGFDRYVGLGLPEGFGIFSDPPTTNVKFEVERFETLEITIEIELLGFPLDSSVYVANPEVKVQFLIRESLKEEYRAEDFEVVVDFSMMSKSDSLAPAIIIFHPENALELEVIPDSLKIRYAE